MSQGSDSGAPAIKGNPTTIGKYEVVRPLGKGAMGMVYLARDPLLEREVALKVLIPQTADDATSRSRFEREAKAVARMTHPNVVTIFDLGYHTDGSPYIAMEMLRGDDLFTIIRGLADTVSPPNADRSVSIVVQVLSGLGHAHQAGIVHRDIKPANIFITSDGGVKLMDFGVARLTSAASMTMTGMVAGTVAYMSPEQVGGAKVDGRSDLFSVGILLFELLSGRRPFEAEHQLAMMLKIHRDPPAFELLPETPECVVLRPVLEKALEKDLDARYQTAAEFAADLQTFLNATRSVEEARRLAADGMAEVGLAMLRAFRPRHALIDAAVEKLLAGKTLSSPPGDVGRGSERPQDPTIRMPAADRRAAQDAGRRRAEEKQARAAAEAKAQRQAEEAEREAERRLQREAEERAQREVEARRRADEEKARLAAEAEARRQAEEARREAEKRLQREAEERAQREAEARRLADEEKARLAAEAETRRQAERAKREAEKRAQQEAEERAQQEAEERAQREAEARRLADEEKARLAAEAETRRQAEKARREAEKRAQQEAEARQRAEEKARLAAEAEARRQADEAKRAAQKRAQQEAEKRAQREAEDRRRAAEEKARLAAEAEARQLALQESEDAGAADPARASRGAAWKKPAAGATAALVVVAGIVWRVISGPTTTVPSPTPTQVPAPLPVAVTIDATPWAQVRLIPMSNDGGDSSVISERTPVRLALPEGSYRLELTGPTGQRQEQVLDVKRGAVNEFRAVMPGADVDGIVNEILGAS